MVGAVLRGALGFAAVSVAAFSVWAFGERLFKPWGGDGAMFPAIAVVFLGLTGLLLHPLAGGAGRFYRAFVPAFFAYAAVWCAAWWLIRKRPGEWVGSAAGSAVFALVAMAILGNLRGWPKAAALLFVGHSAGYFLGGELFYSMKSQLGMLLWGLLYGLGFGAGIGYVFGIDRRSPLRSGPP
jgi:hypothetical protein